MHWKFEYSKECRAMEDLKQMTCTSDAGGINTECAICLTEIMISPIVLNCRHAFCLLCMQDYQGHLAHDSSEQSAGCPLCREPTGEDAFIRHVHLLTTRASYAKNPEDRTAYIQEASGLIRRLIEQDPTNLRYYFTRAEIQLMEKTPKETLKTLEKLRDIIIETSDKANFLREKFDRVKELSEAGEDDEADTIFEEFEEFTRKQPMVNFTFKHIVDVELLTGQAQEDSEEWIDSIDTYQGILLKMESTSDVTPVQEREVFMRFSRCFYALGHYNSAIVAGETAITMNRHFPGVHKHVALSHKELGDMKAARMIMNRAVLYESTWDNDHRQKAYDLWLELNDQTP